MRLGIGETSTWKLITVKVIKLPGGFIWAMGLFNLEVLRNLAGSDIIYKESTEFIDGQTLWQKQPYPGGNHCVYGKVFSNECMINLYYAFIYPYLTYCNHIWGNTYKTTLSKLQILQNKAIRIITGSPPRTNNETLYKHNCMLNLNKINTYLVGKSCMMFIIVSSQIFSQLCLYITIWFMTMTQEFLVIYIRQQHPQIHPETA